MTTKTITPEPTAQLHILEPHEAIDLDDMADAPIEYVSIPSFLKEIPHQQPWGILNVGKFGAQVAKAADGFGCKYQEAHDPVIGALRVFPRRIVEKMYKHLAHTLTWPPLPEPIADSPEEMERARELSDAERADRALGTIAERADSVTVLSAIEVVRNHLRAEAGRIRKEIASPT